MNQVMLQSVWFFRVPKDMLPPVPLVSQVPCFFTDSQTKLGSSRWWCEKNVLKAVNMLLRSFRVIALTPDMHAFALLSYNISLHRNIPQPGNALSNWKYVCRLGGNITEQATIL